MKEAARKRSRSFAPASWPGLYIVVRKTIDWKNAEAVERKLIEGFRPTLELWNRTFSIPYHLFRARLKHIAQENLSRVQRAVLAPLDRVPDGAIVVPVDDDDWFSEDLVARIREAYRDSVRGYYWERAVLEARPGRVFRKWFGKGSRSFDQADHSRYTCGTNNYAVVNKEDWRNLALHHVQASRQFDAHGDRVQALPGMLGIQNRNLASQTVLRGRHGLIGRGRLLRRYRRYRQFYQRVHLPAALEWAQPYVQMMSELMDELKPL
ncbi:MAG: hypothetical protein R3236_02530 [Phycisphaeraceae bacterium]|nr:hypothetical protein [Phycisphaeraceae bacterium]